MVEIPTAYRLTEVAMAPPRTMEVEMEVTHGDSFLDGVTTGGDKGPGAHAGSLDS